MALCLGWYVRMDRRRMTRLMATTMGAPPLWRRLGLVDLGAQATPNGATASIAKGITFLDVQSGDTPQVTFTPGAAGTLVFVSAGATWSGIIAPFRSAPDADGLASFVDLNPDDLSFRRKHSGGTSTTTTSGDLVSSGASFVGFGAWDSTSIEVSVGDSAPVSSAVTLPYTAVTSLTLGYDATTGGREIQAPGAWLYINRKLTAAERSALNAELLAAAAAV